MNGEEEPGAKSAPVGEALVGVKMMIKRWREGSFMKKTSLTPWKSHTGRLVGQVTQARWAESNLRWRPYQAETFVVIRSPFQGS